MNVGMLCDTKFEDSSSTFNFAKNEGILPTIAFEETSNISKFVRLLKVSYAARRYSITICYDIATNPHHID